MKQLKFTSRGKKGPAAKACAKLYADARTMMGGVQNKETKSWSGGGFTITRMVRTKNTYTVDLKGCTRNGLSLDQFTRRISS